MAEIKTGGPAFPRIAANPGEIIENETGMTLRDWFAGQALVGLCASFSYIEGSDGAEKNASRIAVSAFSIADAMLAERERETRS